jgi:hypothetical protein
VWNGSLIAAAILINYQLINVITFLICFAAALVHHNKSVSVIIIVAAIAGPLWITTEEKIPWMAVNSSMFYRHNNYTVSYIVKSSNASLWILCTRQGLSFYFVSSKFHFFNFSVTSKKETTFCCRGKRKKSLCSGLFVSLH